MYKLWELLYDEYQKLNTDNQTDKALKLSQRIGFLITKFKSVKLAVECLKVTRNETLVAILKRDGYNLSDTTFNSDLERVKNEADALLLRAEIFKKQLPKQNSSDKGVNIFDVMAGYSLILGFDLNYETVSVLKFFAIQNQVKTKIKALEKNG